MEFRLPVPPLKGDFSISHQDSLFLLGSCFTENIGEKLRRSGFRTCSDPHGIVYNPLSLFSAIRTLSTGQRYSEADLSRRGEFWFSYRHHSRYSDMSASGCLEKIQSALEASQAYWPSARVIWITLGTAHVYELAATGDVVANCNKMPGSAFRKRLLTPEEITDAYDKITSCIPATARVVFTVSPVRHWSEGAVANCLSKAVLISAVHRLIERYPDVSYFPAYELMLDDLRDYRFYARDMVHPNELAVDYIWERFMDAYFNDQTRKLAETCMALNQAREHRPMFRASEANRNFEADLEKRLAEFREQYPFIDM